MATKKEITEFGDLLFNELKKKGLILPRIEDMEEVYEKYKDMSPKAMVDKFIEDNRLEQVVFLYKMLNRIYDQERISMSVEAKKGNFHQRVFALAMGIFPYINKVGKGKGYGIFWVHPTPPSMAMAKELLQIMEDIHAVELDKETHEKIEQYVEEGKTKNEFIKDFSVPEIRHYRIETTFYHATFQKRKEEKEKHGRKGLVTEIRLKAKHAAIEQRKEQIAAKQKMLEEDIKEVSGETPLPPLRMNIPMPVHDAPLPDATTLMNKNENEKRFEKAMSRLEQFVEENKKPEPKEETVSEIVMQILRSENDFLKEKVASMEKLIKKYQKMLIEESLKNEKNIQDKGQSV